MANMNLVTGYKGTNHVTAEDMGSLYAGLFDIQKVVLKRGNQFDAEIISNTKIRIKSGDLIMKGRHARLTASVDLSIDNGASGYKRNDLIVARYTKNASSNVEECNLVVIKGTATSGSASDPAFNDGDILDGNATSCDFPLYRVSLNGLTASVTPLFSVYDNHIPTPDELIAQISASTIIQKLGYTPTRTVFVSSAPTPGTTATEPEGTVIEVYA